MECYMTHGKIETAYKMVNFFTNHKITGGSVADSEEKYVLDNSDKAHH